MGLEFNDLGGPPVNEKEISPAATVLRPGCLGIPDEGTFGGPDVLVDWGLALAKTFYAHNTVTVRYRKMFVPRSFQ